MIIYKTTNLINGKIYIGQDTKNNPKYKGSGTLLCKSFEKYGFDNFKKEIIESNIDSMDVLNEREIYWISYYNSTNKEIGYNLTLGGKGSKGHITSQETREKIAKANIGKTISKETKRKMSVSGGKNKGLKHSIESKKNMSISKIGNSNAKGMKHTIETKLKCSIASKRRTKESIHLAIQKRNHTVYHTNKNIISHNCIFCKIKISD